MVQPRAAIYRASTRTLLVASEGGDKIVEVDALSLSPSIAPLGSYNLNEVSEASGMTDNRAISLKVKARAPSGLALSHDERTAYVWCRSTYDVAVVPLRRQPKTEVQFDATVHSELVVPIAEDPLTDGVAKDDPKRSFREAARLGRRLFYNATDDVMSEDLACAACHPEGREDGFVWQESPWRDEEPDKLVYRANQALVHSKIEPRLRQTPMLAGRVEAKGPYGWLGKDDDLLARARHGFALHRWVAFRPDGRGATARSMMLAAFVHRGLTPPPKNQRALTATERRGKQLFNDPKTQCATCHVPQTGYTDRIAVAVGVPAPKWRQQMDESGVKFKTPDLSFVGSTPPYFHNGSVATLEELIVNNDDRMGKTNHLSRADQRALIAFLRTL